MRVEQMCFRVFRDDESPTVRRLRLWALSCALLEDAPFHAWQLHDIGCDHCDLAAQILGFTDALIRGPSAGKPKGAGRDLYSWFETLCAEQKQELSQKASLLSRIEASDISEKPIQKGLLRLGKRANDPRLRSFVAEGLMEHQLQNGDAVVLAGLGGLSILEILYQRACHEEKLKQESASAFVDEPCQLRFYLSPQRRELEVLLFFEALGIPLTRNDLIIEKGHFYQNLTLCFDWKQVAPQIVALGSPVKDQRQSPQFLARLIECAYAKKNDKDFHLSWPSEAFAFFKKQNDESLRALIDKYRCMKIKHLEQLLSGLKHQNLMGKTSDACAQMCALYEQELNRLKRES